MNELPRSTATSTREAGEDAEPEPEPTATGQATPPFDYRHDRGAVGGADHRADREVEVLHREHDRQAEGDDHPGAAAVRIDSAFAHVGNVFGRARLNAIIRPNDQHAVPAAACEPGRRCRHIRRMAAHRHP
jgi:hypothetical protein